MGVIKANVSRAFMRPGLLSLLACTSLFLNGCFESTHFFPAQFSKLAAPEVSFENLPDTIRGGTEHLLRFSAQAVAQLRVDSMKLQFSEDGEAFADVATLPPGTVSYLWRSPERELPRATLRLVAQDTRANASTLSTRLFRVRITPPRVTQTTQESRFATRGNEAEYGGECEVGADVTIAFSSPENPSESIPVGTAPCEKGKWAFHLQVSSDGQRNLVFSQTNALGLRGAAEAKFIRDNEPPRLVTGKFKIGDGDAVTRNNYVKIAIEAEDRLTKITALCFKSNRTAPPTPTDRCWAAVKLLGAEPAQKLNFKAPYTLGFSPIHYTVRGWLRDELGNISELTNSGAGTPGTDTATVLYSPPQPPVVINVVAAKVNQPSSPPEPAQTDIAKGELLIIKWKATSSSALASSPISLYYTLNDKDFIPIRADLPNAASQGCTIDGTSQTGCFVWKSEVEGKAYFKIRVTAKDTIGMVTASMTNPLNNVNPQTGSGLRVIAGNTDPGTGASAASAMFIQESPVKYYTDTGSLVVTEDGVVYFRDLSRGLLKIDPVDGVQQLLIPTTGAQVDGPIGTATLKAPHKIALGPDERLWIYDYDRIRRLNTDKTPPTLETVIGGGTRSDATLAPRELKFNPPSAESYSQTMAFFILPNGKVYFQAEGYGQTGDQGFKIRVYDPSNNTVSSIVPNGSGYYLPASLVGTKYTQFPDPQAFSVHPLANLRVVFNPESSQIQQMMIGVYHSVVGDTYCLPANLDKTSFASTGPHPAYGGSAYCWGYVEGRNGQLLKVDSMIAGIFLFDLGTQTWTKVVGTERRGVCDDGTPALSCDIDPDDAYLSVGGQLYFMDRGRLRTVDEDGKIRTIFGQGKFFGDQGAATSARFNSISTLDYYATAPQSPPTFVLADDGEMRFKEFPVGGAISTLAGNGSGQGSDNTSPANTAGIGGVLMNTFAVDHSTGDLYAGRYSGSPSHGHVSVLHHSTLLWSDIAGGSGTGFATADGAQGGAVNLDGYGPQLIGMGGANGHDLLVVNASWNPNIESVIDALIKIYQRDTGTQSSLLGKRGAWTGTFCPDGTLGTECLGIFTNIWGAVTSKAQYDSVDSKWLLLPYGGRAVRSISPGGNMGTLANLADAAKSFVLTRDASGQNRTLFYCSIVDGKIHKLNPAQAGSEAVLDWPIPTLYCSGLSMVYIPGRNALYFPFTQNGLMGVAEYLNP